MIDRNMPGLAEYMHAQQHAPHPEREAYKAILEQRSKLRGASATSVVLDEPAKDKVLAIGPSPNGGVELLVRKSDGVVVLLMPNLPQVRNTPRGPKQVKTQAPLELPLVRRNVEPEVTRHLNALWGRPSRALLLFQSRFTTVAREFDLNL